MEEMAASKSRSRAAASFVASADFASAALDSATDFSAIFGGINFSFDGIFSSGLRRAVNKERRRVRQCAFARKIETRLRIEISQFPQRHEILRPLRRGAAQNHMIEHI